MEFGLPGVRNSEIRNHYSQWVRVGNPREVAGDSQPKAGNSQEIVVVRVNQPNKVLGSLKDQRVIGLGVSVFVSRYDIDVPLQQSPRDCRWHMLIHVQGNAHGNRPAVRSLWIKGGSP